MRAFFSLYVLFFTLALSATAPSAFAQVAYTVSPLVIDLERSKVTVDEEIVDLTYKEYELLRFLSSNPGKPFTREALLKQKALPVLPKRFVCLALEDNSATAPMIYHEEPIYRNGVLVGSTTSGAWGHRVNLSLGLGYVHNADGVTKDWIDAGKWEAELAWKRYSAKVQFQSFYDPKGERIKA